MEQSAKCFWVKGIILIAEMGYEEFITGTETVYNKNKLLFMDLSSGYLHLYDTVFSELVIQKDGNR